MCRPYLSATLAAQPSALHGTQEHRTVSCASLLTSHTISRTLLLVALLMGVLPLHAAPLQWPASDALLEQTAQQIRALVIRSGGVRVEGVTLALPTQVRRFYEQRAFRPIWVNHDGVVVEAAELLQTLKRAEAEGLAVEDYPVATIERRLLGVIDGPLPLANLDLLLTDAFLYYSRNVRSGRFGPWRAGDDWLLPYTPFDGSALLTQALTDCTMSQALAALPPPHTGYRRLRTALQQYRALAAQGGWPVLAAGETLRLDSDGPRVEALRERLRLSGDLPPGTVARPALFDVALQEAVLHFQRRHGLNADGSVGRKTLETLNQPIAARIRQIEANMGRWRWLPRVMAPRRIEVNMAGYGLQVIEDDLPVMQMRVIVGRDYRQTPVFASEVSLLVLNPDWVVPPTILREDILPALRRNPAALKRLHLQLFGNGRELDARTIDWSTIDGDRFPYTLRQEPGPQNPLGRIKFLLDNSDGIYLHDTPDRHLFDRPARALSSGCIRLEYPLELAFYLLADPERWSRASLEEAIDDGKSLGVTLPQAVPILFTYWTVWVDEAGVLQWRDDIYGRDRKFLRLQRQ